MSASVQFPENVRCAALPQQSPPSEPAATSLELAETVIEPTRGWQLLNVSELWRFRELLGFLVWRDVKIRYKQTVLGAAWAVLQPTMMMVVLTICFAHMAKVDADGMPYPIFVYAGLLPWTFFAAAVVNASNSVVGAERLITKIYFPRLAIPFASVGAAVVDFVIAFGLLILFMFWYGIAPGPSVLLLPIIFGMILLAAVGVGTLLAALTVAYRDFRYVIPVMIQVWMFATPTIYLQPSEESGGVARMLLNANPLVGLIASFRASCLGGPIPWDQLVLSSLIVVAVFLTGCFYFRKVEDSFADVI